MQLPQHSCHVLRGSSRYSFRFARYHAGLHRQHIHEVPIVTHVPTSILEVVVVDRLATACRRTCEP
jgi:hypothetical protein